MVWAGLVDVCAGGSGLGEHGGCLKICRVTGRIVQVRGHGQIDLHGQTPTDAAHIGNLERGAGGDLAREREIEDVRVRSLQVWSSPQLMAKAVLLGV